MTALGTPFSLATASTTSRSSLLMLFAASGTTLRPAAFFPVFDSAARIFITYLRLYGSFLAALLGSAFLVFAPRGGKAERGIVRCETRLRDVRVHDRHRSVVLLDDDAIALDFLDRAVEAAAAVQRQVHVDLHSLPEEA